MMTPNRVAAFLLIALSLCYGYFTAKQPRAQALGDPGLALFPWLLTICLLLLAGIVLFQDIRGTAIPKKFSFKFTPAVTRSGIGLGLVLVYFYVISYLGFMISSFLFFGSIMRLCGERRPLRLLGYSFALPLFLLVFFQQLFQIPLPKWGILWGVF
jgi:putative tricarboxylic transport membrane protein